ncbi:MAG TPA: serine/threonine-protein kinase [Kofleriaceae bacterium]|nr:serine/threonine-protein kinase [Kofleriaceae bacterium]
MDVDPPSNGDTLPSLPHLPHDARIGRYPLGVTLGKGGMGEVVSARDEQIGRAVAIKRMTSGGDRRRFLREARIQGRLEHPAIVPVHELWHDDEGQPVFVMKQLAGTTLADVLVADSRSRRQLLRAFVDVCLAIEFAHTRGVVHRDLKPSNVMLGDFGEVYVLDWGVAKIVSDSERPSFTDIEAIDGDTNGKLLGTPGYMAPEQIRGDGEIDGRADIYTLGCMLFEILTRKPLHPRGTAGIASAIAGVDARPSRAAQECDPRRQMTRGRHVQPRGPRQAIAKRAATQSDAIAPELDAICVRATALDPAHRFSSARELGDAVQRFLDGDRDLEQRKELAAAHMTEARAALAKGDTPEARKIAMHAAGLALALDPSADGPAEVIGRLMLTPPLVTPPEVDREMEALEISGLRAQSKLILLSMVGYLLFLPIMFAVGFRDPWYIVAETATLAFAFWAGLKELRDPRAVRFARMSLAGNIIMLALLSRIATPFLIAPGLGALIVMVVMAHPRMGKAWFLCGICCLALLGPFLLETVGLLSPTTVVVGDGFRLHTAAAALHPAGTLIAMSLFTPFVLAVAALLARSNANRQREAQRVIQLQAWQLRQLMPTT